MLILERTQRVLDGDSLSINETCILRIFKKYTKRKHSPFTIIKIDRYSIENINKNNINITTTKQSTNNKYHPNQNRKKSYMDPDEDSKNLVLGEWLQGATRINELQCISLFNL